MPLSSFISPFNVSVLFLFFAVKGFSQLAPRPGAPPAKQGAADSKAAKDNFENGNYVNSLQEYEALVKKDPGNVLYQYRLGLCYLYTNFDKSKAIEPLEFVAKKGNATTEQLYDLGKAYLLNNRIDDAIKQFSLVQSKIDPKTEPAKMIDVVRQIEMCENAKKLMKKPVKVTFKNLGPKVNSPFADYNPFAPDEEDYVAFSTKRNDVMGSNVDFDGYKCSDIFYSEVKKGEYAKAKNLGATINTEWVEEIVGLSADGRYLFVGIDNMEGYDDIWVSEKKGKTFLKAKTLGATINSLETETSATTTEGDDILFFSRTPGEEKVGFGGTDIFMSFRLPNGDWGDPINLGPQINTPYDEDFPNLSADGKILYFCSKGHNSMGGFDVFKSVWDEKNKRWGRPQNLGYPVNTTDDNFTFSAPRNGRHGYLSQLRPEGLGDLDVYMVTFEDIDPELTLFVGGVSFAERAPAKGLKVYVYNNKKGIEKQFSEHYQPKNDPNWQFKEVRELPPAEPGMRYDIKIVGTNNKGNMLTLSPDKLPKDMKNFRWMDTKITKVKEDPKNPPKVDVEYYPIQERKEVEMEFCVRPFGEQKVVAEIRSNKRNGNYALALPPGKYDLTIKAKGYQPILEVMVVYDKGDFIPEIKKDIMLIEEGLKLPEE